MDLFGYNFGRNISSEAKSEVKVKGYFAFGCNYRSIFYQNQNLFECNKYKSNFSM